MVVLGDDDAGGPQRVGAALGPPFTWLDPRRPGARMRFFVIALASGPGRFSLGLGLGLRPPRPRGVTRLGPGAPPRLLGAFYLGLASACSAAVPSGTPRGISVPPPPAVDGTLSSSAVSAVVDSGRTACSLTHGCEGFHGPVRRLRPCRHSDLDPRGIRLSRPLGRESHSRRTPVAVFFLKKRKKREK